MQHPAPGGRLNPVQQRTAPKGENRYKSKSPIRIPIPPGLSRNLHELADRASRQGEEPRPTFVHG